MTKHRVTRRLLAVALSVLLVLGCVAPAVAATYESGTYTGTGTGRNGSVALTLTLTNGAVASVDNVTHSETARYWEKAKVLLDRLVGLQTPEQVEKLDAVTGATLSSNAIKEAAKDVLPYRPNRRRLRSSRPAAARRATRISSARPRSCRPLPQPSTAARAMRASTSVWMLIWT